MDPRLALIAELAEEPCSWGASSGEPCACDDGAPECLTCRARRARDTAPDLTRVRAFVGAMQAFADMYGAEGKATQALEAWFDANRARRALTPADREWLARFVGGSNG